MNILITGITGSGGSYLAEHIINHYPSVKVHGLCRWHSTTTQINLNNILDKVNVHECDLLDLGSVIRILQEVQPSKIFHLAAYANVQKCFDTPLSVINNNIMGTANLLEAVRMFCPKSIIQMCSTSEVYGQPKYTPIDEDHPLKPVNPYAVSKLTQEALSFSYFKSWDLQIVITRMFAYINPRRTFLFATDFAQQIAKIEKGQQKILLHGNLDSTRTLIDVRDAMESYWIASEKCNIGEAYNIGGNTIVSVGEVLDILKTHAKIPIKSKISQQLLRPIDITQQIPNTDKFDKISNWKPQYSLEDSVKLLMDYWRNAIPEI